MNTILPKEAETGIVENLDYQKKMIETDFFGSVDIAGNWRVFNHKDLDNFMEQNLAGKEFIMTIRERKRKRSLKTLGYFFAGVVPQFQEKFKEMGYQMSKLETYHFLIEQCKCLKEPIINPDGGEMIGERTITASKWTDPIANEAIEEIIRFGAEKLNIIVLPPLTQTTLLNTK